MVFYRNRYRSGGMYLKSVWTLLVSNVDTSRPVTQMLQNHRELYVIHDQTWTGSIIGGSNVSVLVATQESIFLPQERQFNDFCWASTDPTTVIIWNNSKLKSKNENKDRNNKGHVRIRNQQRGRV